ncbi:hypothetical protein DPMN_151039 [Dreissena polymorpha]|uniref:Uncharacterized protein n=1 Tax=Dreissena polymorpha TaxID=45954 RepID=A0A9D4FHL7_DREPO|nr:hypothetical protein DPMN_151039 [Dreissena polymorpha]
MARWRLVTVMCLLCILVGSIQSQGVLDPCVECFIINGQTFCTRVACLTVCLGFAPTSSCCPNCSPDPEEMRKK